MSTVVHTTLSEIVNGAILDDEQPALAQDSINHSTLQRRVRIFSDPQTEWNILSIYMDDDGNVVMDIEEIK